MNQEFIIENADLIPFRDMSEEDQHTILDAKLNAPESVEMYCGNYWGNAMWVQVCVVDLTFNAVYRVRVIDTPLVIPWEIIHKDWNWAAMDQDGMVFVYGDEPRENSDNQYIGCAARYIDFLNIDTTGIDWRRSKTRRPV